MLRHRVIPIVLIDSFSVLKSIRFGTRRNLGSPITIAKTYNSRNVDELILLDIDASKTGSSIDPFIIRDIADELFMPLTVGGGIRSEVDIEKALKMGADKVSVNTMALNNRDLIPKMIKTFGSQCIVASVDVKKKDQKNYLVHSHTGSCENLDLLDWCRYLNDEGVGEILLNNVDLDGTMSGVDAELIDFVSSSVKAPLIYAGGVGKPNDCVTAIMAGASAIGISSLFHFTNYTPNDCKEIMNINGLPVRL